MFKDLREFISKADELGECKIIEGADWNLEIGCLSDLQAAVSDSPLLLFDNIKGYKAGYRVATNLFSSPKRLALAAGLPLEARGIELVKAWRNKTKGGGKLIPPVQVETGPVKENIRLGDDVNLYDFPAPKWRELDGGRFIGTGAVTIIKDPEEGWVNVGCYRVQVHDKSVATIDVVRGHQGDLIQRKYWDKGMSCPAAVSCGQEPALFSAAAANVAWGISEYDYAGGLKNAPISVTRGVITDLPIPATAEIVLEGEIVPPGVDARVEGPFGEWAGHYASGEKSVAAFRVKSILHRNNPIIQGAMPTVYARAWSLGIHIGRSAALWDELDKHIPGVKGVWMMEEAGFAGIPVISIQQQYGGHAKQAALIAAGCRATAYACKYVIVVDDDTDPSNLAEVMGAVAFRTDPEASIDIIRGCWDTDADPMLTREQIESGVYEHSTALILACKPYKRIKTFAPTIRPTPELVRKVKERWPELF